MDITECPICFENNTNTFKTTCCGQSIHEECFEGCKQINNMCPFCRKEIQIVIILKKVEIGKIICSFVTCLLFFGVILFPFVSNTIVLAKNG